MWGTWHLAFKILPSRVWAHKSRWGSAAVCSPVSLAPKVLEQALKLNQWKQVQIPALPLTKCKMEVPLVLSLRLQKRKSPFFHGVLWWSRPRNLHSHKQGTWLTWVVYVDTSNILKNTAFHPNFLQSRGGNWAPSEIKRFIQKTSVTLQKTWVGLGDHREQRAAGGGEAERVFCFLYTLYPCLQRIHIPLHLLSHSYDVLKINFRQWNC